MAKKCEIKNYIKKLPYTEAHKEYINNKHNEVFEALRKTKRFRNSKGILFTKKNAYQSSVKAVNQINTEFGSRVASIINYPKNPNLKVVSINATSLGRNFTEVRTPEYFNNDYALYEQEEVFNQSNEGVGFFNQELNDKIQTKLQTLYPEIKLTITNDPVWETRGNVFNQTEYNNQVEYRLKAVDILNSDKAEQVFEKGKKNGWNLNKILTELQVPKAQKEIILDKNLDNKNNNEFNHKQILEELGLNELLEVNTPIVISTEEGLLTTEHGKAQGKRTRYNEGVLKGSSSITLSKDATLEVLVHELLHDYFNSKYKTTRNETFAKSIFNTLSKIAKKDSWLKRVSDTYGKESYNESSEELAILYLTSKEFRDSLPESIKNKIEKWLIGNNIVTQQQLDNYKSKDLTKKINEQNTQNNLREEIITFLLAENSFVVEVNTTKRNKRVDNTNYNDPENYDYFYGTPPSERGEEIKDEIENTSYYENLTVPGGTNYTENEISTPTITPSIKGHAQFSTDNGIGWFRSDDSTFRLNQPYFNKEKLLDKIERALITPMETTEGYLFTTGTQTPSIKSDNLQDFKNKLLELKQEILNINENTKTRRILEVQSDLFQKGRSRDNLTGIPYEKENVINTSIQEKRLSEMEKGVLPNMFSIHTNFNNSLSRKEVVGHINNKLVIWKNPEYDDLISKYVNGETTNQHGVEFWILNDEISEQLKQEYKDNLKSIISNKPQAIQKEKERVRKINESIKIKNEKTKNENQFLQLLNKKNNWVTFFVKSIIQDSAKKGYEKVLFPKGDTAAKIEGHQTLEEFKKEKEARIEELEKQQERLDRNLDNGVYGTDTSGYKFSSDNINREIKTVKQELDNVESGKIQLSSIAKFYEETVTNILKKNNYNPVEITDEYSNKWNEVNITPEVLSDILLQKNEADNIIGQANIKAMTVLIDAVNQKQDTLPHEYAHHYIAWNRDSKLVQEGIKKWGSEEALVQSIGEEVVEQKGEALNWWQKFSKWLIDSINNLSLLNKQDITKLLTDALLTRKSLSLDLDQAVRNDENNFVDLQDSPTLEIKETTDMFQFNKQCF